MTNRDLLDFFRTHGYKDITPDTYHTYSTIGGRKKRLQQKENIILQKEYRDGTVTVSVTNDRWSFNGWYDEDNVVNGDIWTNWNCDNEDYHPTGAILNIEETSNGFKMDIRYRKKKSHETYIKSVEVGADYIEDDDNDE